MLTTNEHQLALVIHVARLALIRIEMESDDSHLKFISRQAQDRMSTMLDEVKSDD